MFKQKVEENQEEETEDDIDEVEIEEVHEDLLEEDEKGDLILEEVQEIVMDGRSKRKVNPSRFGWGFSVG